VTYINSTAANKGFCGEHGGLVCTSSNAPRVMKWAWEHGEKVLVLPDQHLGRNTAFFKMGIPVEEMAVWDPDLPDGGLDREAVRRARLLLWKGHCSVHTRFSLQNVRAFRKTYPNGKVIVHPECTFDVVQAADDCGSTDHIIRTITASPEGSVWAVGTEIHLVNRLARDMAPARTVVTLDAVGCLCSTMFRISPNHLLRALEGLVDGEVINRIVVPEPTKRFARVALERMLALA
jgi:quinolinate synthase